MGCYPTHEKSDSYLTHDMIWQTPLISKIRKQQSAAPAQTVLS